jgi:hypothetical protein
VSFYNSAVSLLLGFKPDVGTSFEILSSAAEPITYQGASSGNSVVVTRVK